MAEPFTAMLSGGHRNSLGRTEEAVELVRRDRARLPELFACVTNEDELVRMRGGDGLEKICRDHPAWLAPYVERLLSDVGAIDQPSVQWHVAQMLGHLHAALSVTQARRATALLTRYLTTSRDWIVLNVTVDVLCAWAKSDEALARWLVPELERLSGDGRHSVARRATKRLAEVAGRVQGQT